MNAADETRRCPLCGEELPAELADGFACTGTGHIAVSRTSVLPVTPDAETQRQLKRAELIAACGFALIALLLTALLLWAAWPS